MFGKPTGKLSHSWPRTQAQTNVNFGDPSYDPLFALSYGLSY
jgi:beta-glucosidase